jgi:hypothetical protein
MWHRAHKSYQSAYAYICVVVPFLSELSQCFLVLSVCPCISLALWPI